MPAECKPSPYKTPVLWLSALALAACAKTTEPLPSVRMTVEPYLVPCRMEGSLSCMVSRDSGSARSDLLYGEIKGFRFQWGYRQILQVDRWRILHPDADASDIGYALVKTYEKAFIPDWSFRAVLVDSSALRLTGDTLSIAGYARPILIDAPKDRENLKGAAYLDLRIRPRGGDADSGALQGDSVRVLHPDSTGRLVPG